MTAMRRGIAEHMRRSLDTAAHVTSAIEVDMSRWSGSAAGSRPSSRPPTGVNPTYLAFIARATVETLDWPLGERRDPRRLDRHHELRQPRHRRRARRRQGPDRPGDQERRGAEPARDRARRSPTSPSGRGRRSSCRTTSRAARSRSRTPAAAARSMGTPIISQPQVGDPRHVGAREAAVGGHRRRTART